MIQLICKNCGKYFNVSPSRKKWGRGVYCSRKCQYEGMKKPEEKRECPVCKKEFFVKQCIKKRFCSPACHYKGRTIGIVKHIVRKPYKNAGKIAEWRRKRCIICNTNFIAKKRTQQHCSKECVKITLSRKMSGKNNRFYKNGNSKNKRCYRGDDWGQIRRRIYKRDNYRCRFCGKHCDRKEIQCHHIIPYKNGGTNEDHNLITLCVSCHAKIEQNPYKFNKQFFKNHIPESYEIAKRRIEYCLNGRLL